MTSSTRFSAGSSSEIWTHLNSLDDATVRVVATRLALDGIPSPAAGMFAYEVDRDVLWRYTDGAWRHFGVPRFASAVQRDATITAPKDGDRCSIALTVGSSTLWLESRHNGTDWVSDTGWESVALTGVSGKMFHRLSGATHELRFALTGSIPTGNLTVATLNDAQRPSQEPTSSLYIRQACYLASSTIGMVHIAPAGQVTIANYSGSAKTGADGSVSYL